MCNETKKPEETEVVKPIPNESAWGLSDDEMPKTLNAEEQRKLDEAMEIHDHNMGIIPPPMTQGNDINIG